MSSFIVTGAAGSLGGAICDILDRDENNDVYGTDRYMSKHVHNLDAFDLVEDAGDFKDMCLDIEPDAVIHCAANIYGVSGFHNNAYTILSDDVAMTRNVLESIDPKKTRFHFISSSMVYESVDKELLHERDPDNWPPPRTDYGLSKYVGERMTRAWAKNFGGTTTIWRPFNIITPYEEASNDIGTSHVFADFFENILLKQLNPLPIIGKGNQVRCFTWIEEVAAVIANNVLSENTMHNTFNIGNYEPISMRRLAALIYEEAVDRGHISHPRELEFNTVLSFHDDVQYRVPDISHARDVLGFEAKVKIKESISRCMDEWEKSI